MSPLRPIKPYTPYNPYFPYKPWIPYLCGYNKKLPYIPYFPYGPGIPNILNCEIKPYVPFGPAGQLQFPPPVILLVTFLLYFRPYLFALSINQVDFNEYYLINQVCILKSIIF